MLFVIDKKAMGKKTIGAKADDYIVNKFAYGLDLEAVLVSSANFSSLRVIVTSIDS